jgi:hypothetical protein
MIVVSFVIFRMITDLPFLGGGPEEEEAPFFLEDQRLVFFTALNLEDQRLEQMESW